MILTHWNRVTDWWFLPTVAINCKKQEMLTIKFCFLKLELTYFKLWKNQS